MPYSKSPKLHYSCPIFSTVAAIMRASPDPRNNTRQERTVPWSNHWLSTFNLGWQKRIHAVMQNLNHQSCIDSWVKYTTLYLSPVVVSETECCNNADLINTTSPGRRSNCRPTKYPPSKSLNAMSATQPSMVSLASTRIPVVP